MLGMRSAVVVNVISKGVMIEVVLPWGRGAPSGSGKGEASMVMVGGMGGINGWIVADRLSVGGRGRRIVDYAGTVEELCLSSITSGIIGIGEGVCREGEIGLGREGRGRVVNWSATETGQGNGGVIWVVQEILLRREDVVERESWVVVYLPIGRETRGRMTGPGGGGLTMEFYKSTTTFARDAFSLRLVHYWHIVSEKDIKDLQQGLEPSQGRFVITHWSQACFEVVARVAEVEPLRLLFGALVGFSEE